jgi:hypothetical protein
LVFFFSLFAFKLFGGMNSLSDLTESIVSIAVESDRCKSTIGGVGPFFSRLFLYPPQSSVRSTSFRSSHGSSFFKLKLVIIFQQQQF